MNVIEHYIKEIYSEEEFDWNGEKYVKASVWVDCYGHKAHDDHFVPVEQWEKEKKQGYYLA